MRPFAALEATPSGASTLRSTLPVPSSTFQAKSASVVVTRVRYGPRVKAPEEGRRR